MYRVHNDGLVLSLHTWQWLELCVELFYQIPDVNWFISFSAQFMILKLILYYSNTKEYVQMHPIEICTRVVQISIGWVTKCDWCSCVTSFYNIFPSYFQDNNIDYCAFYCKHLNVIHFSLVCP